MKPHTSDPFRTQPPGRLCPVLALLLTALSRRALPEHTSTSFREEIFMSRIYTSADQLIGATPLLELSHIEREHRLKARILAKLEYFNPAGSVKDRIAKAMIDDGKPAAC